MKTFIKFISLSTVLGIYTLNIQGANPDKNNVSDKFLSENYYLNPVDKDLNKKILSNTLKDGKITRIDPGNWWVGMNNPELQIMIYGKNISRYKAEINYPGVTIEKSISAENPNYMFLYLNISKDTKPGIMEIKFLENNKKKFEYSYPLLQREDNAQAKRGFSSEDVIYLLMPDRFANGNPDNDSHPLMLEKANRSDLNGRHGGDIKGISDNLEYLSDLGITAIWSTPMMEDNLPTYSYHTYAISDYYSIDPRYGTNLDYRNLSKEAKSKGIKLIMDVVTNHCSTEHLFVKDQPEKDWIHTPEQCNFRIWTVQDPYVSDVDIKSNLEGWFDVTMADLNQNNKLLMDYLTQNSIWWIEFADLSGLRIDTYPYNFKEPMNSFNEKILSEYPDLNIVGEVWMHEPIEIAYWQKDAVNPDGFQSTLPTVMDFPLSDALNVFTKENQEWASGIMRPYINFAKDYLYPNTDNLMIFADNHDTERLWRQIDGNIDDYKLIMTILSTVRGIPQIYYGTEIMMSGIKEKGDGDIRKDFPGGWNGDERNCFTAEGRNAQENEVFDYTRKLLNWRKNSEVVHNGKTKHFIPQDNVYVYFRYNDDKKIMVVINNDNDNTKNISLDRFAEMISENEKGVNIINDTPVVLGKELSVPAKTSMIIEF